MTITDLGLAGPGRALRDPLQIPGSKHFAAVALSGVIELHVLGGETVECAVEGITGVIADRAVTSLPDGRPQIGLRRILTHFHQEAPEATVQQNPDRTSHGVLVGSRPGGAEALLPGDATFWQYLLVGVNGGRYINIEPMKVVARGVTAWPPVGATFWATEPVDFYDVDVARDVTDVAELHARGVLPSLTVASRGGCGARLMHLLDVSAA